GKADARGVEKRKAEAVRLNQVCRTTISQSWSSRGRIPEALEQNLEPGRAAELAIREVPARNRAARILAAAAEARRPASTMFAARARQRASAAGEQASGINDVAHVNVARARARKLKAVSVTWRVKGKR